jgi:hypothetical protein
MATPRFTFTSFEKSFRVLVDNLEELSVAQIQEIESFVQQRKGIFDFNSYSFSIQKRLSFSEFVSLLKELNFEARCTEQPIVQKVQERVSFGQYKGMQYNELTDSYLLWLKTNYSGKDRKIIEDELKRRGL